MQTGKYKRALWNRGNAGTKKLVGKHDRLHSGNLETLAASHILASHHVVSSDHVGARFSEAGAVAFVGAPGKLILLGAHQPVDFVLGGLLAMGTVECRCFLFRTFVEKLALFHSQMSGVSAQWLTSSIQPMGLLHIPSALLDTEPDHQTGLHSRRRSTEVARKKKPKPFTAVEAVKTMAREQIGEPPASRVVPNRKKKKAEKHKPTLDKLLREQD